MDPEIAITPARDCIGLHRLHLLRDDADVRRGVIALEGEAIDADAVRQMRERDDGLLEQDVGPSPAAA